MVKTAPRRGPAQERRGKKSSPQGPRAGAQRKKAPRRGPARERKEKITGAQIGKTSSRKTANKTAVRAASPKDGLCGIAKGESPAGCPSGNAK